MGDTRAGCWVRAGAWLPLLALLVGCDTTTAMGSAGGAGGGAGGAGGANGAGGLVVSCHADVDCHMLQEFFDVCLAPDASVGCGLCQAVTDACAADADCAPDGGVMPATQICDFAPSTSCYCHPTKICQPGCRTSADCPVGQACNPDYRCQTTCAPGSCPADFSCGADDFCHRDTCTSDAECSAACVKGACYDRPGSCTNLPL